MNRLRAVEGYAHGQEATVEATRNALARVARADAVIVVEGVSDQIAVETAAVLLGRDLDTEGVAVLPVGGAQAVGPHLRRLGPDGECMELAGLYDVGEIDAFLVGAGRAGLGRPADEHDLALLGFHACVRHLEDELLRSLGVDGVLAIVEAEGDLRPLRTLQRQAAWRDRPVHDQLLRFFGSGARRKSQYARRLVEAMEPEQVPRPLKAVLERV